MEPLAFSGSAYFIRFSQTFTADQEEVLLMNILFM